MKRLGIEDLDAPEWGDAPLSRDARPLGELTGTSEDVPVFWGCGVTPQEAVMRAGLEGVVMAHSPGLTVLLDAQDKDVISNGLGIPGIYD